MLDRFFSQYLSAPRIVWLGALVFFSAGIADGALLPFFPLWAIHEAGIPTATIGLLFACYAGGELVSAPLIGGIADHVGRRPVMILSTHGVGIGMSVLCFVHGTVLAALVLFLTGVCESVLHPTMMTVIADSTPPEKHRDWFSLVAGAAGLGHIVGPAVGAAVVLYSVNAVFLVAGAVLLLAGLVILITLPETRDRIRSEASAMFHARQAKEDEDDDEGLSALLPAFRDPLLAKLLAWVILFEVAGSWIESLIPLYAHDGGALTPSGVGSLFAYAAILTAGLQLVVNDLSASKSGMWLATAAGVVTSLGFVALALPPSMASLLAAASMCSLAQTLVGPMIPTAVTALAPPPQRATYMAASSTAADLKDSLGPAIGTAMYALAPALPWLLGIPVVLSAAVNVGRSITGASTSRDEILRIQ